MRNGFARRSSGRNCRFRQSCPESLEPRIVLAASPLISEFQAINRSTIFDEDGDSADWIEIQNPGSESIDLEGWYLTDDAADLTKWKFPARQLEPNDVLLVFASSKHRVDAGELHSNFRLSGNGEFLALVQPDGQTIEQDFGPSYPAQREDGSYGITQRRESKVLIDGHADVRAFVPTDESLGLAWTQVGFDDDSWESGVGPVGFENLRPAAITLDDFDSPLSDDWTVDLPASASGTVEVRDGALRVSVPTGDDTTAIDRGLAPIVYRELPAENATDWEFIAHVTKDSAGDRGSVGIMIFDEATGKPALMLEQSVRRRFALISGGAEFEWTQTQAGSFYLRLARNELDKTWSAFAKIEEADEWTLIGSVTDGTFEGPVVTRPRLALFARSPVGTIDATFESVEVVVEEQRPTYGPLLGLDVGSSMSGVNASTYLRFPFQLDEDPDEFAILSLGSRFDDGFDAFLNGELISRNNTPENVNWNSAASRVHGAVLNDIPLTQESVSGSRSLLREGDNVLAIHGMNVSADDADFFFQGGLVASRILSSEFREFGTPTPGAENVAPAAPEPQLVGRDGLFFGTRTVELRLEEGASDTLQIRYTLDGSEPTRNSSLYSEPLTIGETAALQARTFDTLLPPNFEPSRIASSTFVAISESLRDRTSNLPLLVLDTFEDEIPGTNSNNLEMVNVALLDVDPSTSQASLEDGVVDYLGRGGVRRRGSSSGTQPKPQLAFELWGPDGTNRDDDFDASLLGLAPESDWVLHAPFGGDPAFMRNALGFELSNQMDRWAPKTRFLEVYINDNSGIVDESHYAGLYVLMEKIKPGPGRLDIATVDQDDVQEPEISGGYIWKVDRPDPDAPVFPAGGGSLNWVHPESPNSTTANPSRKATPEQQSWVESHFDAFAETLVSPDINDPEGYAKYIDVDAWVDYHLMQVVMYNADALGLSIFFHKDRGEKIAAGPLWDLNLSAESTRIDDDDPSLWLTGANFFNAPWWRDLARDPGFWQRYVDRFQVWRQSVLADENLLEVVSSLSAQVGESADRNATRWPDNSFRNVSGFNSGYLDGTFGGEVIHLQKWLQARMEFLDGLFTGPPEILHEGNVVSGANGAKITPGQEVEIVSAPIATPIDQRLVSGVPGETMASYFVPTDDSLGETWTQSDFDDAAWAVGPTGLGFERRDNFAELIKTTVDPREVADGATNILARIPFNLDDLNSIEDRDMVLRMQFEDGYIAYLNGELVARDHVTSIDATWDARGVNQSTSAALEFKEIDISQHKHLLVSGTNVLAIRVLNSSPSSGEMLLVPELVLRMPNFERRPDARVIYTIDGTDPRGADGAPAPTALELSPGDRLTIERNTRVTARNLDATDRGEQASVVLTDWSSPVQFDFVVDMSPVVISEINYNPGRPSELALAQDPNLDARDLEFIELHNRTNQAIDISGWQIRGGVTFDFVATEIAGGETIVITRFNPSNGDRLNAFRAQYGIDASVPIVGGFEGQLSNNRDRIELTRKEPQTVPADEVSYEDEAPWNAAADGLGPSLHREELEAYGNAADSWRAKTPSPGSVIDVSRGDFNDDGKTDGRDIDQLSIAISMADGDVRFDISQDGTVDSDDRDFLVRKVLGTNYGDANLDGVFDSQDIISVFAANEYEDGLVGNSTWSTGDWDGDGEFGTRDWVLAFMSGKYVS